MVNRRIIDQTEAMSLSGDDYLVADNANLGTRKIQFTRLLSGATPLPPNYKTGLGISRVSATTFSVASGYIRSDDNSRNIQLSTSLIKNISATFDLGNNAGCMPSGLTLQANTKYYVFAISTSGGNSDIIVDTSIDCLNGLADNVVVLNNFDKFAKLGYFITNASSQIVLSQIENQDFKVKTGSILMFGSDVIPDGYLACNGATISRTTYADLFAVIGTRFGVGDGSTTFNLPNYTTARMINTVATAIGVRGNGKAMGFTHNTADIGYLMLSAGQYWAYAVRGAPSNALGTNSTDESYRYTSGSWGLTPNSSLSGVVADMPATIKPTQFIIKY
jgi:microcystin-dependent protein